MPDYASLASPRKMESYSKETVRHRGFNAGNILGDPFALATVLIGAVSSFELYYFYYILTNV